MLKIMMMPVMQIDGDMQTDSEDSDVGGDINLVM